MRIHLKFGTLRFSLDRHRSTEVGESQLYKKGVFPKAVKIIFYALAGFLIASCNSESALDCFQSTGELIREEVMVDPFTEITVFENISLIVKQGETQKVEIETGDNLREEVTAVVSGSRLLLRDTNDCNFFREYGVTKVYVTVPNLTEIRSSTGWPVESDSVLSYADLRLISESFVNTESETTDGAFDLEVAAENLNVVVNGIAYFKLRGTSETFNITIAAGDSRIEAEDLMVQNVVVNHRGSNDILVDPQLSIRGVIRGTGDVISNTRPDEIAVEELYKGRLLFKD
ncbi:DUF2807 domain-containing protein [Flavobacteriaceae bacterium TP-CH-4]|uniref:DUF2807 domain-containing protein n=1 Tax=Pelagihabitans pacificus TaxID=2696054 RepID=A0A967EC63_9FLAO|nr:head GIN domain-containing protein [Pelagihabitans pacificus]NHF60931.1 DUF2807 domain-containing protein [Pelagihabitans pacificus]